VIGPRSGKGGDEEVTRELRLKGGKIFEKVIDNGEKKAKKKL